MEWGASYASIATSIDFEKVIYSAVALRLLLLKGSVSKVSQAKKKCFIPIVWSKIKALKDRKKLFA